MERDGYDLEAAEGTFELLLREALRPGATFFEVESYRLALDKEGAAPLQATAAVRLRAGSEVLYGTAGGHGALDTLHRALRTCLAGMCPEIQNVRLVDYKVRLLDARAGTEGKVRVLVRWACRGSAWSTAGVSDNVVEASWNALLDAVRLELMRLRDGRVQAKGA